MVSSEFVVKVSRHPRGSGNPGSGGAPATGFRLVLRLAGMTSLQWDAGETECSNIATKLTA
jgi:hypothetical protein